MLSMHMVIIPWREYTNMFLMYMIQHTGHIAFNTICINKLIDFCDNPDDSIDLSDNLHKNIILIIVNTIILEWIQTIRCYCIPY